MIGAQPSQEDVRRFWCRTAAKVQATEAMDAMETIAGMWIEEHPEYAADLGDEVAAVGKTYAVEAGKTNPFLHLSMHLSITEQCSIDQPRGIRQAVELLVARKGDLHEAHHAVMDALGEMLHNAQRDDRAPDGQAYVEAVQRKATKD
jgi:hypothetical protein